MGVRDGARAIAPGRFPWASGESVPATRRRAAFPPAVPEADLRLFGKPESFVRRRMGVALATGASVEEARERARTAASCVKPVAA